MKFLFSLLKQKQIRQALAFGMSNIRHTETWRQIQIFFFFQSNGKSTQKEATSNNDEVFYEEEQRQNPLLLTKSSSLEDDEQFEALLQQLGFVIFHLFLPSFTEKYFVLQEYKTWLEKMMRP